jgi:hypothetical protein
MNATVQFGPDGVTVRNNGPVEGRAHFVDKNMVITPWGTTTPKTVAEQMDGLDQTGAWIGPGADKLPTQGEQSSRQRSKVSPIPTRSSRSQTHSRRT